MKTTMVKCADGKRRGRAISGAFMRGMIARMSHQPRTECPYNIRAVKGSGARRGNPTWARAFGHAWIDGWVCRDLIESRAGQGATE